MGGPSFCLLKVIKNDPAKPVVLQRKYPLFSLPFAFMLSFVDGTRCRWYLFMMRIGRKRHADKAYWPCD